MDWWSLKILISLVLIKTYLFVAVSCCLTTCAPGIVSVPKENGRTINLKWNTWISHKKYYQTNAKRNITLNREDEEADYDQITDSQKETAACRRCVNLSDRNGTCNQDSRIRSFKDRVQHKRRTRRWRFAKQREEKKKTETFHADDHS